MMGGEGEGGVATYRLIRESQARPSPFALKIRPPLQPLGNEKGGTRRESRRL